MFSLIVTIISIALVAALALATIYYGGTAFNQGSARAETARLLTEAQQVEGAILLFKSQNQRNPTSLTDLAQNGEYLKSIPKGWDEIPGPFQFDIQTSVVTENSCIAFNKTRHGFAFVPSCDDPQYQGLTVCCSQAPVYAD